MSKWELVEYDADGELIAPDWLVEAKDDDLFLTRAGTWIGGNLYSVDRAAMRKVKITLIGSKVTHVAKIQWPEDVA